MSNSSKASGISRRDLLGAAGTGAVALAGMSLAPGSARATAEDVAAEIKKLPGGAKAQEGRVSLKLPQIAENGRTVPVTITVDSPMTDDDYVKAVHLYAEGNPVPNVASFELSPLSGKAEIATRMRLAKTQDVVAAAEMSDGSVFTGSRKIKVTIGGCGG